MPASQIPASSEATGHQVTVKFTDLMKGHYTLAEIPMTSLQWSLAVDAAGSWQGSFNINDRKVQASAWNEATAPNLAAAWIEVDGVLVYGGRVTGRSYDQQTGIVSLSGTDWYGYLSQRLQAKDYTEYTDLKGRTWWAAPGAGVPFIAYTVIEHALQKQFSIPIVLNPALQEAPEDLWITFSAPKEQHQTLDALMSQMHQLGYLVGVDLASDSSMAASGRPVAELTVSYPRRGQTGAGVVLDTAEALPYKWSEDGTQQATRVAELTGGSGASGGEDQWDAGMEEDGYPLLEQVVAHPAISPTALTPRVIQAFAEADLAMRAYPLLAPEFTFPMFGSVSVLDLQTVGDNVTLKIPKIAGGGPPTDPRFPGGLEYVMRTVRLDCTVPAEGEPTMKITLNIPPNTVPQDAPS